MNKMMKKALTLVMSLFIALSLIPAGRVVVSAIEDNLVNVALQGSVSATNEKGSYTATKAIDGDTGIQDYWESGPISYTNGILNNGKEVSLTLTLDKEYDLQKLVLYTYPGSLWYDKNTPREYRYTVFASSDNKDWKQVASKSEGVSEESGDVYDVNCTARYIKVRFDGSNVYEVQNDPSQQILHLLELEAYANVENNDEDLVNIAKVEDFDMITESGRTPESICDGNFNTLWATNSWKNVPTFTYTVPSDNTKPIRKLTLDFEGGQHAPDRIVDITLEALYKGESEKVVVDTKKEFSFLNRYSYEFEGTSEIEQLYVTLSNPKLHSGNQVLFLPAFTEVGIYVDKESSSPNMSKFSNVASNALITPFEGAIPETDKDRLVDKDYQTLFTFHRGAFSTLKDKEVSVILDLGEKDYDVNAFEIAFEKAKTANDTFNYTYSIYTQSSENASWIKQVDQAKATRRPGENIKTHFLAENDETVKANKVKVVLDDMTSTGWPSMAEFKIFAVEKENIDGSISYKKPTHTNTKQEKASKITDGKLGTSWTGEYFPGYVDIDLEKNYDLNEMKVYLPTNGYSTYDVYTSMDGVDFKKVYSKTNTDSCASDGDIISLNGEEARIVRVYINYQSGGNTVTINEVKIFGEESGTPLQEAKPIEVESFEGSQYDVDITSEMAIEEVQGIITRQLGDYVDWFSFEIQDNPNGNGYDYFELSDGKNGEIHIVGNNGVSLATGLNHYLKYYLNVNISQVGNQVSMPDHIVSLNGNHVYKETKLPIRYAYNYCTHSYSMPFWGEEEWRNELDWLALNGVNVVLDITGQEEVWRRFLMEVGYTQDEAKDFIAGPAYYAWAYMANMYNYGGPVHNSWFEERVELARKNQFAMRKLGMQPIMQGYSGMVPVDIEEKDSDTRGNVIAQNQWNGFQRPTMLKTTSPVFNEYAKMFYDIQKDVFGDITDYYATDPFHEGGLTGSMKYEDVSRIVLDEMIEFDEDAVWVIQSWQKNPTPQLLAGIGNRKDHALILDLWAEKDPRWDGESHYGYTFPKEFDNTPWVWCLLNNFGGRPGLKGYLDVLVNDFPKAYNETEHMTGIGITPEASYNNPVIYDLFFEMIWVDDADAKLESIDKDAWIRDYITRRYGSYSEMSNKAWDILNETVYNSAINNNGEGPVCSVINARPGLDINNVSCCDSTTIKYDKEKLEEAAKLLLADYEILSASEGYQYDLSAVLLQVLANTAQEYQKKMSSAFRNGDLEEFEKYSEKFMEIVDETDLIASTQSTTMVGTWIEQAKDLAENADSFSEELYEFNARSLVSTWGSRYQANSLHDYSNRQWSGLTKDLYKKRWQMWIDERVKELKGEAFNNIDWFEVEWEWANSNNIYPTKPANVDMKVEAEKILKEYVVDNVPKSPAEDDSRDLDMSAWTATAGSEYSQSGNEGPVKNLFDNNTSTIWHTKYTNVAENERWINIHMSDEVIKIDGLRYQPRQGSSNGNITSYVIEVSNDNGKTYTQVAEGNWAANSEWKIVSFDEVEATDVRINIVAANTGSAKEFIASGAEVRLTGPVDKSVLSEAVAEVEKLNEENYTQESWAVLEEALNEAKAVLEDTTATKEVIAEAVDKLNTAKEALVYKSADYTKVDEAIKKAEAKLEEGIYTEVSVKAVEEAINAVVRDLDITKQAEVDAMATAIEEAMNALEMVETDKTILEYAITLAEKVTKEDLEGCVDVVVEYFNKALANARKVYEDENATKAEVTEAWTTLFDAIHKLDWKKADVSDLKDFVAYADTLVKEDYYEKGWARFEEALAAAKELIADGNNIDQEAVNAALKELMGAASELRSIPDKSELEDLITKVEGMKAEDYTAESWAAVETALANAKAIYNAESDEAEVKAAQEALNAAIKGLEPVTTDSEEDKKPTTPDTETGTDTGDSTNVGGLLTLLGLAGMAIAYETRKRMR